MYPLSPEIDTYGMMSGFWCTASVAKSAANTAALAFQAYSKSFIVDDAELFEA